MTKWAKRLLLMHKDPSSDFQHPYKVWGGGGALEMRVGNRNRQISGIHWLAYLVEQWVPDLVRKLVLKNIVESN